MLCELETDKVSVEVPAPASGVLTEILAKEGETASRLGDRHVGFDCAGMVLQLPVATLVDMLMFAGVRVDRAAEPFHGGDEGGAGTGAGLVKQAGQHPTQQ